MTPLKVRIDDDPSHFGFQEEPRPQVVTKIPNKAAAKEERLSKLEAKYRPQEPQIGQFEERSNATPVNSHRP